MQEQSIGGKNWAGWPEPLKTDNLLDKTAQKELLTHHKIMKSSEGCKTILPTSVPVAE